MKPAQVFPFLNWFRLVNRQTLRADFLAGLTGAVSVRSEYGLVDLGDLAGPVHAYARGESIHVHGLQQGGTFDLRGANGEFTRLGGPVAISSFMGTVSLAHEPNSGISGPTASTTTSQGRSPSFVIT